MDAPLDPRRKVVREQEVVDYNAPVVPVQPEPVVDNQRSYSRMGDAQVETTRQGFYDTNGNLVEREEQVFDDPYTRRYNGLDRTAQVIYFLLGLLEIVLAVRFIFRLLGASTANGFANFIFNVSTPFVAPFNGIFNDQALSRVGVFEISTLLAMVIYALIAWGIVKLMYVLFAPNRSTEVVQSTTRRRRV
jgi:uncharacterized protein YggT (Ycf19 family)